MGRSPGQSWHHSQPGSRGHLASLPSPWAPGGRLWSQALQGLGSVASFDSLQAACYEHRTISSEDGRCSEVPRMAASSCPLPAAQPGPLPGLPHGPAPRPGQSRREAEGGAGPQGGGIKPGHRRLSPKMGQGWGWGPRTLVWAESGRPEKHRACTRPLPEGGAIRWGSGLKVRAAGGR